MFVPHQKLLSSLLAHNISILFFNCYLAAPRPTLGNFQRDSLANPMLITRLFDSFDSFIIWCWDVRLPTTNYLLALSLNSSMKWFRKIFRPKHWFLCHLMTGISYSNDLLWAPLSTKTMDGLCLTPIQIHKLKKACKIWKYISLQK